MAPMDYLQDIVDKFKRRGPQGSKVTCSIGELIREVPLEEQPRQGYVDLVLSMVNEMDTTARMIYQSKNDVVGSKEQKYELVNKCYEKCIDGIKNLSLNTATMRELLLEMDNPKNSRIRRRLWTIVFGSLGEELASLLRVVKQPVYTLEECKESDECDVRIYNIPFKKKYVA